MPPIDQPKLSQQQHFLHWNGDIADSLLLVSLEGNEALSSPFLYELRSLTRMNETEVGRWHNKMVSCQIGEGSSELPQRILHGVVTRIRYAQRTSDEAECILTLEPALALLKLGRVMRIWQNISVPDVVCTLLRDHGINQFDLQLYGSYPKREYCMQYRESAFNFIERLLAEEGIYYFFCHNSSGHTLVLADHPASHSAINGETLSWHHQGRLITEGNVDTWTSTVQLLPAGISLQGVNMSQAIAIDDQQRASESNAHVNSVIFTDITPQGERSLISREAQQAMAAREANTHIFSATVNAHWLCSGETFTLTGHPSGDKSYRIQSLAFSAANNFDNNSSDYHCQLEAMNNDRPWHPPYPQSPEIAGILTATVVGPSSEEIHTDEYGRIKIQFPWDKEHPNDDTCSCWVRVAQPWAGGKFGAQFIPRVGCEVLVNFIQGNPDYPLITGMVYNGQHKPPFILPDDKNESGFITRSTTNGSVDDGHRLSFNDKKGEERLTLIAQKDLSLTVKNDITSTIAANRSTELTKGNDRLVVKQGDMRIILEKGSCYHNITGNAMTKVNQGDYTLEVVGGCASVKTNKALTLESDLSIELKVGNNKINLSDNGISISGSQIQIDGSSCTELKGSTISIEGRDSAELKGKSISIKSSGQTELTSETLVLTGSNTTNISGKMIYIG